VGAGAPAQPGRRFPGFELLFAGLGALVLLLVVAPLLGLFLTASVAGLSAAAADAEVLRSVRLTLGAALTATLACTVTGVPLAYLLARHRFPGRAVLLALADLPVVIPHTAAGIALLTVIGRHSLVGRATGGLVGTYAGITVAMAFVSLPYLLNAAREAFTAVPVRLEQVARTLGASPGRVFFTLSLPLAWRGVLSGMILMWARGISEFGAVVIIAYYPMTTPVLIFQRFNDYGLAYARSAAQLLIAICVVIFIVLRLVARKKRAAEGDHA
jgi:molybdate/tungstate transport system permease protein